MNNTRDERDVMETASATTSPDNANSGPFAYVITAVALGLLLVLSLVGAGCTSLMLSAVAEEYGSGGYDGPSWNDGPSYDYDYDYDYDDSDLRDLLERYYRELEDWGDDEADSSSDATTVSVDDALDFDLAPYGSSINDEVSASAYAGTPAEVRDFVRELLSVDRDYSDRVARCLDAAALNEDARDDKLSEARDLCDEAKQALDALEVPQLADTDSTSGVRDLLGSAKSEAARRWELMDREIELLCNTDTVDTRRLWDRDDDVVECTEDAGEMLEDAMAAAAGA